MKNFIKHCLTTIATLQLSATVFSQSWNLVWQEDFGVVPDSVYSDFADPSKTMPGHKCAKQGQAVQDGWYAIVSHVYNDPMGSWWYEIDDHTGNKDGGLLLVNTEGTLEGEIIYRQKIEFPICSTNKYKFVMYAGGSTNFGGILPSLEMVVLASDGSMLGQTKTGGIPMLYSSWDTSGEPSWSQYEVEFDPGNYEWVEFQLINRAECTAEGETPGTVWDDECQCNKISCGAGNDFVLDDIQLFRQDAETVPDPDITNNSLVEETSLNGCLYSSSYSIPSKVLDDWHKLYKNIYFLWQESEDGYTWNDIAEPISGIDKTKTVLDVDASKSMQYRVIITGADESEAKAKEIAKQISENGGPDDGCYLFSISNTLSAALPKPDCKYRKNLRTLWTEDFGVCDTMELRTHSNALGTFYEDDGVAEFDAGKYVITSCPSLAIIQSKSWNVNPERDSKNAKDSKGKAGGAFLYGKTSVTDTLIYQKEFAGPFCNCKAYMFNVDVFKNLDWGTLPIHIDVLDGKEVIGEASGIIPGGQGGWITLSAPFQLPSNFDKSVTLRIYCPKKYLDGNKQFKETDKNVSFGIDNLSVAVCGETMPDASVYIDGDKSLSLLSGFDCTDETPHTIDFDGMADWIDLYPDAAFIWQTSVDGGATWSNLSASATSIDYEYTGDLESQYRVVIGETKAVAQEVAANGKPNDGCSVYYVTNFVGFKCKESGCRAPKFSFDENDKVMTLDSVFCGSSLEASAPEKVEIKVIQTNKANVDEFYIATMGSDNKWGDAKVMTPKPTSTDGIWKMSFDKKSANYQIYAVNDTCESDTFYINLDVREPIELKPVDDQLFCATEKPTVKIEITSGEAESVFLKYGSHEGKAEVVLSEANVNFPDNAKTVGEVEVTAYAESKDGKCKSEEITFNMDYEEEPEFTFTTKENIVCKSEKAELDLNITPSHNSDNHIYEINGSDGSTVDIDDLVVFPTEKTTYTVTATSEICKSKKTEEVEIDVELPQAIDLSTVPSPVLQTTATGSIVCAPTTISFTVSGDNLTTWDWESRKKGENDFSKWDAGSTKTTNDFEITEETSFRVSSAVASTNVCKAAYSDIITIEAENKPVFSLTLDKDRVCENGDVELTLVTNETYDPSQISATANGNPITLTNSKYSNSINETTKFEVTVSGKVCAETNFDTTAYVDHPLSFTLAADKTKICQGGEVTFTVTGESDGIVWYESTDGKNYTEFTPANGNKITPDETIYVYAGTPSDGACGAFKVDPIKIEVEKPISFDLISDVKGKICAGTEVNFTIKNLVGTPNTSKWEKNDIEINAVSSYKDTPVSSSTYKVTLNGDVCPSVEQDIEIEVESADALTLTADKSLICEGESVTLTKDYGTNDPAAVTWWSETDGVKTKISEISTVSPSKSTSYYLSVKGSVCDEVYSQPAIVEVEPKIDFELKSDVNELVCEGTEVTLALDLKSGNPENVTFTANGDPDPYDIVKKKTYKVTPAEETKYELTLQGSACSAQTKSVNIKIQKQPKFSVTIDKTGVCEGEDVTITPTAENVDDLIWKSSEDGGVTFSEIGNSTSAQTFTPNKSIIYSITTEGTDACDQVVWTQEVEVEPAFKVALTERNRNIKDCYCKGDDHLIIAYINGINPSMNGKYQTLSYEWQNSLDDINYNTINPTDNPAAIAPIVDTTTTFTVKVSGKYCKTQTDTIHIKVDVVPIMTIEATADTVCEGDEVTLTGKFSSTNVNNESIWISKESFSLFDPFFLTEIGQPSPAVVHPTESCTYRASAHTLAGCEIAPVTKQIIVEKAISLDVPSDTSLCEGGEVKFSVDGSKGYQYAWTIDGDTLSNNYKFTYDGDEPANVKLEVKGKVCEESYNIAINVVPTPHIVSVEESGNNAFEFVAEGGSGAYMFDFGNGYQSSSTLSPATYGRTYKVKVKDELGCESDTTIKTPTYELEFPVSFTPNGDGENDVWEINNIDKYPGATVKIFDRFGKKLCDMKAAEMDAWDGTYNGRDLPSTDYWYEIQIDEIDKTYVGHFTLIRN